jgi:hypothetical protein
MEEKNNKWVVYNEFPPEPIPLSKELAKQFRKNWANYLKECEYAESKEGKDFIKQEIINHLS